MRRITLLLPLLFLGPAACSVAVTGAPCDTTDECPAGEVCGEGGVCREKHEGEEGNCECRPGESQRCAGDGTRVTCQEDPVCPFYPAGGGEASVSCECGALGDSQGSACDTPDATICGSGAVLQCRQVGSCLVWERAEDCGAKGLVCEAFADGADPQCVCPSNPTPTTLYVDPLGGSRPAEGVRPTGVKQPAACRFERVTDAFASLPDERPATVVVTGFDREKWDEERSYNPQDPVIPTTRNGWLYRATTGGKSGRTEPVWPTVPGALVSDGEIAWENVGPDAIPLEEESFPLVVPPSVALTSSDCPAGGGDACGRYKYALVFGLANGGDVATAAVTLSDRSVLSGLAVVEDGATAQASAVECSEGTATVEDVWLVGDGAGAPGLTVGVSAQGSCDLTVRRGVIGLVSSAGVVSQTTESMTLEGVQIGVDSGRPLPLGSGLYLERGRVDIANALIESASMQGIIVDGTAEVTLNGSAVRGNGRDATSPFPGILVKRGILTINGTNVDRNGLSGLLLKSGNATVDQLPSRKSTFNENGAAGIQITGGIFHGKYLEAAGNRTHGVEVGSVTATLEHANLSNNGAHGLLLGGTAILTVTGGKIDSNVGDNVHINDAGKDSAASFTAVAIQRSQQAGLMLHGGRVTLTDATVAENQGAGIEGSANGSNPSVTLTSSQISGNVGTGVKASRGRWSLSQTSITSNGAGGGVSAAGMEVAWEADLQTFSGNKIYRNERVQLRFIGPFLGGLQTRSIPGSCAPGLANQISCYPPGAGLEVNNKLNVQANGVLFQNDPAREGQDYIGNVTGYCPGAAPVSCTAP